MPVHRKHLSSLNLTGYRGWRWKFAMCLLAFLWMTPVIAGIFSVTPVRIYMAANERASAVTVTNDGDDELVMQSDIYDWRQSPDGKEVLTLSQGMILSPPILKMAPRSSQVLRLISLNSAPRDQQQTYRMVIRQIPEAKPSKANVQLQIAYAFSIPIFLTPHSALAKLECALVRGVNDVVKARCQNDGTATAHTTTLEISRADGERIAKHDSGAYILPGAQKIFMFKESLNMQITDKNRLVVVMSDGTRQSYDKTVDE